MKRHFPALILALSMALGVASLVAVHPNVHHCPYPNYEFDLACFGAIFHNVWASAAITVPLAFAAGMFILPHIPAIIALQRNRKMAQRRLDNLCISRGYDLCKSVERCPECGTPTAAVVPQ